MWVSSSSWRVSSGSSNGWPGQQDNSGNPRVPPNYRFLCAKTFVPDQDRLDTTSVSGRKFDKHVQSTPWSVKAGLAGKEVSQLRVMGLTRKGLAFNRSVCEAVFLPTCCEFAARKSLICTTVAATCTEQLLRISTGTAPNSCGYQFPAWYRPFVIMFPLPHPLPIQMKSSSTQSVSWKLQGHSL